MSLYTIALCTSYALTYSVRKVKLLKELGGGEFIETDKVFTILFIYLFVSEVLRLSLSS